MGPYYEICPVGENVVWIVWQDRGVEMKREATLQQREALADLVDRQNVELQRLLRQIATHPTGADQ